VEAAAMNPVRSAGVLSFETKKGRTGSFDMVELKIAKAPMTQRIKKYGSVRAFLDFANCINNQQITV
jgi:hypothetical protein